jgi:hypothetical protein
LSRANGPGLTIGPGVCRVCLKNLDDRRPGTSFCTSRCRLLHWGAKELAKALRDGMAEGLRSELEALIVRVEVVKVIDSGRGTAIEEREN